MSDGEAGAFYTNSTVTGNCEDYIYRNLAQNVDANYRTIVRSESRGNAGHSMGGYGAVTLAMKYPGRVQRSLRIESALREMLCRCR